MQFPVLARRVDCMQAIPTDIMERFLATLKKRDVPVWRQDDYKKWLRYFLDLRVKYPLPDSRSDQVRLFIQKLRDKKQTLEKQKQAAHAISLFFESPPKARSASIQKKRGQSLLRNELQRNVLKPASEPKGGAPDGMAHHAELHSATEPPIQKGEERKRWGARYNTWRCPDKKRIRRIATSLSRVLQ
jgi:hypothetical protein